jgi:hypothetical protein
MTTATPERIAYLQERRDTADRALDQHLELVNTVQTIDPELASLIMHHRFLLERLRREEQRTLREEAGA